MSVSSNKFSSQKPLKIAILVSGGVDSSVALALIKRWALRQSNRTVHLTAYYLKIWLEDDLQYLGECPWEEDLRFATSVCNQLGVPLQTISLQSDYWKLVVEDSIEQLKAGLTPSPDILCNQKVKFGRFLERVGTDFDWIVSGHYAWTSEKEELLPKITNDSSTEDLENSILELIESRLKENTHERCELTHLLKSSDVVKDQTYFLCHLSQQQLAKCLFPLGPLKKNQARLLAEQYGLINAARKDSQGICFLGKFSYNDFVRHHLGERNGEIIDIDTQIHVGIHHGYWFHTIGQRKGLGLSGGPWFVVEKDIEKNIVYVSHQERKVQHTFSNFSVKNFNWLSFHQQKYAQLLSGESSVCFKVRHGPNLITGAVEFFDPNNLHVTLSIPDQGLASGQYAVMYDQKTDICLGGGVMSVLPL